LREVKYIKLILENCEEIMLKKEHIGIIEMFNINRTISRRAMNYISDALIAENIFIQISSKANVIESYSFTWNGNNTLPFDRLTRWNDITAIDVHFEDGSSEYILVNWNEESDFANLYQTSKINQYTGDLYIAISEKYKVEDYFEKELVEKDNSFWELYEWETK
jgi:hypothetical protein